MSSDVHVPVLRGTAWSTAGASIGISAATAGIKATLPAGTIMQATKLPLTS